MQGLGNQMFQYAAGRSLSLHLDKPLKVNISNYSETSLRQYELNKFFEIDVDVVSKDEMKLFKLQHPVRRFWNKLFKKNKMRSLPYEEEELIKRLLYSFVYLFRKPHLQKVYEEPHFHYDKNFYKVKQQNVFLKGYWMSYKYFEKYKDIIKKDFKIRQEIISDIEWLAKEMNTSNSIALHIRCTDKLSPNHLKLHGKLSKEYYKNGIEYIKSKRGWDEVCLYIFSDDIVAAKEYISDEYKIKWISKEITKTPIEDFYLMQNAQNIITSNSTFSWWAAFLNKNEESIKVVPKLWYVDAIYDAKDIYLNSWIKIKN